VIQIRWTGQAVRNLEDIKSFISKDSPAYALAVVSRLYLSAMQLQDFPDLGRVVPELGQSEIRELVRPPYRIVYRRRPDLVEILLVFRSSLPLPSIES
jgi:plasmid stabilization system protein ParE